MQKEYGELVVYEPTDNFRKWAINEDGLILSREIDKWGLLRKLTIKTYKFGSYKGIIGLSATFNGKPI